MNENIKEEEFLKRNSSLFFQDNLLTFQNGFSNLILVVFKHHGGVAQLARAYGSYP